MKKIKVAIVITMLVSVASVICLLLGNFPNEKVVFIASLDWLKFSLPFAVSPWWNLLLSPLAVMVITYAGSCDLIVGKEPHHPGFLGEAQFKYKARLASYHVTFIASGVAFSVMCISVILSILTDEIGGPLSSLIFGIFTWIVIYVSLGVGNQFLTTLSWESCEHSGVWTENGPFTRRYQMTLVSFVKLGLIKSFPFLLGLTCGYILRQAMSVVGKFTGFFKTGDTSWG